MDRIKQSINSIIFNLTIYDYDWNPFNINNIRIRKSSNQKNDKTQLQIINRQIVNEKVSPDLIAILAFIILSRFISFRAVIEDCTFQHDRLLDRAGQEVKEYHERTGETTRWTTVFWWYAHLSDFSPATTSVKPLKWIEKHSPPLSSTLCMALHIIMMLGFYISRCEHSGCQHAWLG